MSTTLTLANGLHSTDNSFYPIKTSDIEEYVQGKTDLYEVTFRDGTAHGRAHIDIDGKMAPNTSEEDFHMTHQMLLTALSSLDVGTPFALCTSSKYQNNGVNKLSYSLIFTKKSGSNRAVANWTREVVAPRIKEAVEMILPFYIPGVDQEKPAENYIDYDPSVYSKNRKMRMVGSTKPNEDRPKVIVSEHGVMDTLISYIPEDCEALPEPEVKVANEIIMPVMPDVAVVESVLRDVVMALKPSRADNRQDWLSVGIALYNEGESVELWDEFSQQSPKYKWGECQRLWRGFRKGNLTQRTLWKMLKEDNPDVFKMMNAKRKDLENAFSVVAHVPYAQYFVICRPDDYLYDVSSGWWYIQPNKTWATSGQKFPPGLTIAISRTLYAELEDYRQSLRDSILRKNADLENTWEHARMKCALDGSKSVLQAGFLKSVAEVCQGLYAEQTAIRLNEAGHLNVRELMDGNPMLFAFKDCVYDFSVKDGVAIGQRPIEATDYIVTTCGYNYPTRNTVVRQEIEKTLKGIWSKQEKMEDGELMTCGDDGETYEYVMKILSTTLCGVRWAEAFYILTGRGRNGKGLLFELLQKVMGDYYYQLPVSVLTTKIDHSGAPNPEFANLPGRRIACCSEPEANERLQEGTIKEMTGGDVLTGRALYGNPVKFKPQFALFLQCNTVPNLNGITKGGVLRNVVVPFPFIFVDQPNGVREKKGNPMVKDVLCKSAEWRDEMWFILLDHFESIRGKANDAIPRSKLVKERTDEYVEENNAVGVWWKENYTNKNAKGEYVLSKQVWLDYKAMTGSQMSDKVFKQALEFNDLEVKKVNERKAMEYKGKMCIAGWRKKTDDEKKADDNKDEKPESDDEKKEE